MPPVLSPGQWLARLEPKLTERWARPRTGMGVADAYYVGDQPLAFATAQFREAFGAQFAAMADNWMQLVVQATAELLTVQGFRFGADSAAAERAWEIWQENDLDTESQMVHTEAIKLGEAYWLVAPPPDRDAAPVVTCEHPSQVIVERDPANRRRRLAALKKWRSPDGYVYAIVYTPEWIAHYRSQNKIERYVSTRIDWRPDDRASGRNPFGVVPIVPMRNDPEMLGGGVSDLTVAMPIQDALNKLLSDMLLGAEYQAFPQRVILGVEKMTDAAGNPLTATEVQIRLSRSRVLRFAGEHAKIAEWTAANLDNFVNARQHLVRGLTAKTRVPPDYVLGEIINASGDALEAAHLGLTSKTEKKAPALGGGHEEMASLTFLAMRDDKRAQISDSEVIWKDFEKKSFAQRVDGATKMLALGVPQEMCWEAMGFSPQQIARAHTLNMAADLQQPPAPETTAPPETAADPAPVAEPVAA